MSPGGHLVTTVTACAAAAATTESWPLVAGLAAGGFWIDVDHAIDYVVFERQRDLRPGAFLRYYLEGRVRRTVLALHDYAARKRRCAPSVLANGWYVLQKSADGVTQSADKDSSGTQPCSITYASTAS